MNTKPLIITLTVVIILIIGFFALNKNDYKKIEYVENSTYFGNELKTDLNDDGREDVVFLVTAPSEGSGTFYYVVAALNTDRGYIASDAFLLGDRIAPQTTEKGKGKIIIVNYADRAPGEPFTTPPSVGKSVWLILDPDSRQFGTVEQNFEGEADPAKMTLTMKTWVWNDDKKFTITFGPEGKFTATTDCNSVGGSYVSSGSVLSFSQIFSTKMFCEGSKENDFTTQLEQAQSFKFTSRGELILESKTAINQMTFK